MTSLRPPGCASESLSTPGHTPGSVCLLCENTLFSGDTLFAGSYGRTDFPAAATRPCPRP
ncbi:MAG: MBL fold metallo-hydrolase [Blautia wexlerae]